MYAARVQLISPLDFKKFFLPLTRLGESHSVRRFFRDMAILRIRSASFAYVTPPLVKVRGILAHFFAGWSSARSGRQR